MVECLFFVLVSGQDMKKETVKTAWKLKRKIYATSKPEQTAKPQTETVLRNSWEQALHANENTGAFEKLKYDKQEHVLASTSSKKARACVRDSFATKELKWWLHAIPNAINNINIPQVDFEISTDASDSERVTYVVTPIGGFDLHLIMPSI